MGFYALFFHPVVIAAEGQAGTGVFVAVVVFCADPFVKAVLSHGVVAEVPFAEHGFSIGVGQHFCDGWDFVAQVVAVDHASVIVRVQAGHEGSACGCAYGLGDVGVFKDKAALCEGVLMRRLYPVVAVTPQGVCSLLVADEEQDVRLF